MSSRGFQDVSLSQTVLVNKSRRIEHASKTYCKDGYLQKDLARSHFWEIYGQCTKLARMIKIYQVLVFHFTAPFLLVAASRGVFRTWSNTFKWAFLQK